MAEYVTLARPYAKAAFDFAKNAKLVEQWLDQLNVSAGIASLPEIAKYFISPDKENDLLISILVGKDSDQGYINFVALMADNNRLSLLPEVVNVFKFISEQDAKSLSAEVFTAVKLTKKQLKSISDSLAKRTAKSINLTQHIDVTLLSGARVVAGDLVIDGSLKAKLEKLKTELLN